MCCQVARLESRLATILNEPEEREKEDQFAGEPSLFEYEGALGVVNATSSYFHGKSKRASVFVTDIKRMNAEGIPPHSLQSFS